MERPSVPLVPIGEPGPPKIVEIQEKYTAVEGTFLIYICRHFNMKKMFPEQAACCYMFIEGNPAPYLALHTRSKARLNFNELLFICLPKAPSPDRSWVRATSLPCSIRSKGWVNYDEVLSKRVFVCYVHDNVKFVLNYKHGIYSLTLSIMSSSDLSAMPMILMQWWILPGPKRPWAISNPRPSP